ncbi:MAG: hypothetical protein R3E89_03910 [Thiolinea sp.]
MSAPSHLAVKGCPAPVPRPGPFYLPRLVHNPLPQPTDPAAVHPAEPLSDTELQKLLKTLDPAGARPFRVLPPLPAELADSYSGVLHACRQSLRNQRNLPSPTGEDNLLSLHPRGLTVVASPIGACLPAGQSRPCTAAIRS